MLAKTFNIGTLDATGLLNRVVCDTATDIRAVKLNCAEDRRMPHPLDNVPKIGSLVRQLGAVLC
jgi:hypothetical protein